MPAIVSGYRARFVRWPQWCLKRGLLNTGGMGATYPRHLRLVLLVLAIILVYGLSVAISGWSPAPTDWDHKTMIWEDKAYAQQMNRWPPEAGNTRRERDTGRVFNRTLGFEKVFSIGLKERTDKRDAMTLMSSLTGFDIEWVEGVRPGDIPDKAVPFGIDVSAVRDNFLGSWRGHMNVIRQ